MRREAPHRISAQSNGLVAADTRQQSVKVIPKGVSFQAFVHLPRLVPCYLLPQIARAHVKLQSLLHTGLSLLARQCATQVFLVLVTHLFCACPS
jgi:hypothetical protein